MDTSRVDWEAVAKEAYRAYGQVTDFKNYQGLPMPAWEALTPTISKAWIAAAKAASEWSKQLFKAPPL